MHLMLHTKSSDTSPGSVCTSAMAQACLLSIQQQSGMQRGPVKRKELKAKRDCCWHHTYRQQVGQGL